VRFLTIQQIQRIYCRFNTATLLRWRPLADAIQKTSTVAKESEHRVLEIKTTVHEGNDDCWSHGISGGILDGKLPAASDISNSNGIAPNVLVTPQGPTDGGDFGPNALGTTTAGIQEAINSLRGTYGLIKIMGTLNLPANSPGITLYPGIGLEGEGPLAAFQTAPLAISKNGGYNPVGAIPNFINPYHPSIGSAGLPSIVLPRIIRWLAPTYS
jgi:hypothetical protein